jgi:hypothetical protein
VDGVELCRGGEYVIGRNEKETHKVLDNGSWSSRRIGMNFGGSAEASHLGRRVRVLLEIGECMGSSTDQDPSLRVSITLAI